MSHVTHVMSHVTHVMSHVTHVMSHVTHVMSHGTHATRLRSGVGWLRLVNCIKYEVFFAKKPCFSGILLQKGPGIYPSLPIVTAP